MQCRQTLNSDAPWVTLTNSLPAASGTNWTSFVHYDSVQYPEGVQGGDSGLAAVPSSSQAATSLNLMTAEQRAARLEENARRAKAAIEEINAAIWAALDKARADRQKWIAEGRPVRQTVDSAVTSPENASGENTAITGFYRVVRNGIYFAGVTNGTIVSGRVMLPIEVGLASGQSLDSLYANSGTDPAQSVGVQGLEFVGLEFGRPQAVWDTAQVPNGVIQINLGAFANGGVDVPGSSVSVIVSNQIWFPDPYNWAGYYIEVQAQSVYSNGTYHVDIYDDTAYKIIEVDGLTDAEGYLTYGGVRGFRVQNYDSETFEQYPSAYYQVVVTTSPAGAGFGATAVAINTNFVWIEKPWPASTYQHFYTQFAIAYQPIYGNPALGGASAVTSSNDDPGCLYGCRGSGRGLGRDSRWFTKSF